MIEIFAHRAIFENKDNSLEGIERCLKSGFNVEIDVRKTTYLDFDVIEILEDFAVKAKQKNIHIKLYSQRGTIENPDSFVTFFKQKKEDINV